MKFRDVRDALRLLQSGEAADLMSLGKVYDFQCSVTKCCHKEPLAFNVNCHMVDSPVNIGKNDRTLLHKLILTPGQIQG